MWFTSLCDHVSAITASLFPLLADATVKGTALLVLTSLAALAMRRASAAARHLMWFLSAVSLLLLPMLATALPGWNVLPRFAFLASPPSVPETSFPPPPITISPVVSDTRLLPNYFPPHPVMLTPKLSAPMTAAPRLAHSATLSWQTWVIIIWAVGAVLYLSFILLACLSLWRLQRNSSIVNENQSLQILTTVCGLLGFHRPVKLITTPWRAMPMTWGILQTWILLPAESSDWTPDQTRAVLMHEVAHARRWDCLTHLIAQFAFAIFWFNPLVWLTRRQMQSEREQACDDLVLSTGTKASSYAEQLLHIATEMPEARCGAAAIAMARKSTLESRLLAILDATRNRRTLGWKAAIAALFIATVIATPLAMLRAESTPISPAMKAAEQWASSRGWKEEQVTKTTLLAKQGGWRDLPFSLTSQEQAEIDLLTQIARTDFGGDQKVSPPEALPALENILKKSPHQFYAEFLLGNWYSQHGDAARAGQFIESAYRDAPVVIIQRYEFKDGSPAAYVSIPSFALECNRVKSGYLDPSLELPYFDLKTDAEGCIYLPVCNTVYRTTQMALPAGYTAQYTSLGWIETSKKVGLLPVATLTPATTMPTTPTTRPDHARADDSKHQLHLLLVSTGDNPYLSHACDAIAGNAGYAQVTPERYESDAGSQNYAVIIFDRYQPKKSSAGSAIYFGCLPPDGGLAQAKDSQSHPAWIADAQATDWNHNSPMLQNLSLQNLFAGRVIKLSALRGWDVLARCGDDPLILSRQSAGKREVVALFDLLESNWPLKISFPAFLHRAIEWEANPQATTLSARADVNWKAGQTIRLTLVNGSVHMNDGSEQLDAAEIKINLPTTSVEVDAAVDQLHVQSGSTNMLVDSVEISRQSDLKVTGATMLLPPAATQPGLSDDDKEQSYQAIADLPDIQMRKLLTERATAQLQTKDIEAAYGANNPATLNARRNFENIERRIELYTQQFIAAKAAMSANATRQLKRVEQQFNLGLASRMDYERAKSDLIVAEAERTGDAWKITQARLEGVRTQLNLLQADMRTGLKSDAEREDVQTRLQDLQRELDALQSSH